MEISDRRYQELLALMRVRQGGSERADPYLIGRSGAADRTTGNQAGASASRDEANKIEYRPLDLRLAPTEVAPSVRSVLLVDPDPRVLREVEFALRLEADVETRAEFWGARARLLTKPPDLLVTNIRLRAYNGLNLVHLAAGQPTRCVVYAEHDDVVLAREAQASGAFYERAQRLIVALPSYVRAVLPARDRRAFTVSDPRQPFRNGRRCTDYPSTD